MPTSDQVAALDLARGLSPTPSNLERVRREVGDEAARWAFAQWELRGRAKGRFPSPDELLYVREALEQATHQGLADYHASFFPVGETVVDLTCGLGGDLLSLARRGPVIGFELDPERADYARWNLRTLGLVGEVLDEDGLAWLKENGAPYVIADPARRVDGRRTLDPSAFTPDPAQIVAAAQTSRRWVLKLTPMLPDDTLNGLAPRVEFVSFAGECREALLVGGSEPIPTGVWAVRPGIEPLTGDAVASPVAERAEGWLFDADPAAVRSHALGEFGLRTLGDSPGYLIGPEMVDSPWLRPYRVIEDTVPKRLKGLLKSLGADAPILKQRGAGQNLDVWRKDLGRSGKRPIAVAFYVQGSAIRAVVLDPPK